MKTDLKKSVGNKKTPWHIWFVGIFFFLLNFIGAYDYLMTMSHNITYFTSQNYNPAQILYFSNYPILPLIFWTIGIISALAASVLLLFRSRWAVISAIVAVISQIFLDIITFGFMNRWNTFGASRSYFDILILLIMTLFWLYCRREYKKNILTFTYKR